MKPTDLVLGAMFFGTRNDERQSFDLLEKFVAAGGRTIDTANCYAFWASETDRGGQSETTLGRWLAANPGVRDELTIATKVGVEPTPAGPEGLSGTVIARAAERSLDRLGIDTIDLYWAHGEDRSVDPAETVAAFGELVAAGSVRRLGVSNHPVWRVEQARTVAQVRGVEPYTALQLTMSLVQPRPGAKVPGKDHRFGFVTDESIDYLQMHPEIEAWIYSPLIQGSYDLADRPLPEPYEHRGTTERLARLHTLAERLGTTPGAVVLAWLAAGHDDVPPMRPIIGVSSPDQLAAAMQAASLEIPADELDWISGPR